jgi:hypothetical protein
MKSLVSYLQGLYSAMLSDIAVQNPPLRLDSERDVSRLLSLVNSRGLSFLMTDLPEAGKHFDRSLANRRLTKFCTAGQRPYKSGGVIPRLFKGLLLRVFDDSGVLRAVPDVAAIRALRQLYYGAKKFKITCDDSYTWKHVHEFFETDLEVHSPSLNWDEDELVTTDLWNLHLGDSFSRCDAPLLDICNSSDTEREGPPSIDARRGLSAAQWVADLVTSGLGTFEGTEWRAKHGPGAVADQRRTQFKYDFPCWPAKLESAFPLAEFGFPNYGLWAGFLTSEDVHVHYSDHEPPSRLIAVPKTFTGPRLIASEPVAHQWCQQMLLDYFTSRLLRTPLKDTVHFHDQSFNGDLAKRASHTQSHVTVDLSSASDRLSCWAVERVFRRSDTLVRALHATRTRWIRNDIDAKSPQFHKLRKFACMGSACTFPVQSIVFSCLAIGAVIASRHMTSNYTSRMVQEVAKEVLVFGDDIIIPTDGWVLLQEMLRSLGLRVNPRKTYDCGNFRESCGIDAYDGNDVTPCYIKAYPEVSRPESVTSSVEVHNNFAMQGWSCVSNMMKSRLHSLRRFAFMNVPPDSGLFGLTDIEYVGNSHLQRRWNPDLQISEVRADIPYGKVVRTVPERDSVLMQYFTVSRSAPRFLQGDRLGQVLKSATSIRRRWVPSPI